MGFFDWLSGSGGATGLDEIFKLKLIEKDFVETDAQNIYSRILTDALERTDGIKEDQQKLLWDNCLGNESQDGLVTLIAKAMVQKSKLFLIYDSGLDLIRKATTSEEREIEAAYKAGNAKTTKGVFITFQNYNRTDMVKLYSTLEYCTVSSLYKSMHLSKAIQMKLANLRSSTGSIDSADVKAQAIEIAKALSGGKDVAIDGEDIIETAKPDLTATNSAMEFINEKRSFYLGMPASWITGEAAKGLGDSGEGDAKQVERGLKNYYFSIIKPVIEKVFDVKTTFKSEDFRQLSTSLELLKTFELTSDELISRENKQGLVNKSFGLPKDAKGDAPAEVDPNAPPAVTPPGGQPPKPGAPVPAKAPPPKE